MFARSTTRRHTSIALVVTLPLALACFEITGPGTITFGYPVQVLVADPARDKSGPIDVLEMVLRFDSVSGAYQVDLTASPTAPFSGDFRININLFNIDAGSLFQDVVNDYSLSSPRTTITLTGISPALTDWTVGDRVHTNSLFGTPDPPGSTLYRTSVMSVPFGWLTNEDYVAFATGAQPAVVESARARAAFRDDTTR